MGKKIGRPPRMFETAIKNIQSEYVDGKDPGVRLPAEKLLAERFGINLHTIRAALVELERQRLLIRKPAGGSFVAEDPKVVWKPYTGKFIALVFPNRRRMFQSFNIQLLNGINSELFFTGINVTYSTRNWRFKGEHLSPAVHFKSPDILGFLLIGQQHDGVLESLQTLQKPIVALDYHEPADLVDSFSFDNYSAGTLLAKRLFTMGHRRIVGIFETPDKPLEHLDHAWQERRQGFSDALAVQSEATLKEILVEDRGRFNEALNTLNTMLAQPESKRPTALFMPCNILNRIKEIATEHRIKIPRQLTIVGCDGEPAHNTLTGMRFDSQDLSTQAIRQLLRRIRDSNWRKRKTLDVRIKAHYRAGKTHARPIK